MHLIVKARVALGHALQTVIEIKHNLVERQVIDHHGTAARIGQVHLDTATVLAKLQNVPEVFVRYKDRRLDARLFQVVHIGEVGHIGRVVQLLHRAVFHVNVVNNARRGGDEFNVILALDPVADHLKVQKPEEPTAKAKAQRRRCFHLVAEARIIERQLFNRVAQVFKLGTVHREQATEHHRHRGLKARQCLFRGTLIMGDRVAHLGVAHLLDGSGQKADLPWP